MREKHMVRFGRTDNSAIKTLFLPSRKEAMRTANAIAFVLWWNHAFNGVSGSDSFVRHEQDGFWVELIREPEEPDYLFQGD